jgi:hypothetical protein
VSFVRTVRQASGERERLCVMSAQGANDSPAPVLRNVP